MSAAGISILNSLEAAVEAAKKDELKVSRKIARPVKIYKADEIKLVRQKTGMPQSLFAKAMGVSIKTIEAWEA